ncbi:ATP-binding cassette domain-containing protein, partial [Miniimonas arenae]|uniref:ATP-binding cassette domain-containing protein n=1 Tax=Miniimonas arenae TaxID=676201 RepID=UPI0028B193F2
MSALSPSSAGAVGTSQSGAQLRLDGVSLAFGDRRVLTDVSFAVGPGERVSLIGENGTGKSTLLRLAAGLLRPDSGSVAITAPGGATPRVGLLHQEPLFPRGSTVAQALESAVAHVRDAQRDLDDAAHALAVAHDDTAASAAYASALERAEQLEVWDVDARVATMLAALGLSDVERTRPTDALSGGQRARLSLAWVLLSAPDVLLLDEPTNHLDDAATAALTGLLATWRGPVLLASHDRAFLDEAVTALVDLDPVPLPHAVAGPLVADGDGSGIGVTRFTGSYHAYLNARLDARERWERRYAEEQAELKRLRGSLRDAHVVGHPGREPRSEMRGSKKFYSDRNAAVVSRRVDDARARLDALTADQVRKPPAWPTFRGLDGEAGLGRERGGGRGSGG